MTRALAGALVLFLLLEALTRAGLVNEAYLPPASSVLVMTGRLLADTEFLVQVAGTLQAWAVGLLVAIAIAIPLGVVMGSSRRTYLASITVVDVLRPSHAARDAVGRAAWLVPSGASGSG